MANDSDNKEWNGVNDGEIDENIIINELDGLPNVHPNLGDKSVDTKLVYENSSNDSSPNNNEPTSPTRDQNEDELDDLPTSLIVTNIDDSVFTKDIAKKQMEDLFRQYGEPCTFQWLRSFRRLRVNYISATSAVSARLQLHQYPILNSIITCYFAQPVTPVTNRNLELPAPVKQFLISPPASPPVDWQPRPENEPLVNHDLLAALANLTPGEAHELFPPGPGGQPGIVVHAAGKKPEDAIAST